MATLNSTEIGILKVRWEKLLNRLEEVFGEHPDLQTIIFLIGVQELGSQETQFTKDQKMDLMHIATCRLLSQYGYYKFLGKDAEGWPQWEKANEFPHLSLGEQEKMLRKAVLTYFETSGFIRAE